MICRCEAVFAEAIPALKGETPKLEIASSHRTLLAKTFSDFEKAMRGGLLHLAQNTLFLYP